MSWTEHGGVFGAKDSRRSTESCFGSWGSSSRGVWYERSPVGQLGNFVRRMYLIDEGTVMAKNVSGGCQATKTVQAVRQPLDALGAYLSLMQVILHIIPRVRWQSGWASTNHHHPLHLCRDHGWSVGPSGLKSLGAYGELNAGCC